MKKINHNIKHAYTPIARKYKLFVSCFIWLFLNSCKPAPQAKSIQQNPIKLIGKSIVDTVKFTLTLQQVTIKSNDRGLIERVVEKELVKKNELLIQFDNYDAFVELSGKKESFKEELTSMISSMPNNLGVVKQKWIDFEQGISPRKLLPPFPEIQFREESNWIMGKHIISTFNNILAEEKRLKDYFIVAPFDGFILKSYSRKGDVVDKNSKLLLFQKNKGSIQLTLSPLNITLDQQELKQRLSSKFNGELLSWKKTNDTTIEVSIQLKKPILLQKTTGIFLLTSNQFYYTIPKEYVKNNSVKFISEKETKQLPVKKQGGKYFVFSDLSELKLIK